MVNASLKATCNFSNFNHYKPIVKHRNDYYPFGMLMPGRGYTTADEYRYGFQGMEKDDEWSGSGNAYTTEFRGYDPRLGRWKSIDPLAAKFPWQSPYVAFDNNPIYYKDPKGLAAEGGDDKKAKKGDVITGNNGQEYTLNQDEIVIDWTTSGSIGSDKGIPTDYQSSTEKNIGIAKTAISTGLDYANEIKSGSTVIPVMQAVISLSDLINNPPTPMDAIPIPGVGLLGSMLDEKWDAEQFEFEQFMAGTSWGHMREFASNYNTENHTAVIFVYAASDVHEGVLQNIPTPIAYPSREAAEKALGFSPTVVYYKFLEEGTQPKVSTTNKISF